MGEGGYETHGESGGHDRSGIHNPSVEEMGRRKGGRTRKERKRTKTSYRRLIQLSPIQVSPIQHPAQRRVDPAHLAKCACPNATASDGGERERGGAPGLQEGAQPNQGHSGVVCGVWLTVNVVIVALGAVWSVRW